MAVFSTNAFSIGTSPEAPNVVITTRDCLGISELKLPISRAIIHSFVCFSKTGSDESLWNRSTKSAAAKGAALEKLESGKAWAGMTIMCSGDQRRVMDASCGYCATKGCKSVVRREMGLDRATGTSGLWTFLKRCGYKA